MSFRRRVNLHLSEDLYKKLAVWCAENDRTFQAGITEMISRVVETKLPAGRAVAPAPPAIAAPRIEFSAAPPPPPPPPKPQFKPVRGVTDDVWQQEIGDRDSNKYERCYIICENHNRKILGMPEIDCAEWRAEKYWRCVEDGGNVPP